MSHLEADALGSASLDPLDVGTAHRATSASAVGALSYAEQVNITIVADRDTCPDLDVVAGRISDALTAMGAVPSAP